MSRLRVRFPPAPPIMALWLNGRARRNMNLIPVFKRGDAPNDGAKVAREGNGLLIRYTLCMSGGHWIRGRPTLFPRRCNVKRRTRSGAERDVHSRWRRRFCWTQKSGAVKKVKRIGNRRERREGKQQARRQDGE